MRLRVLVLAAVLSTLVACGGQQQGGIHPRSSATVTPVQAGVSTQALVTIPPSYVGRWLAHAAYLQISADGSGVAWSHWGICTSSRSDQRMCALVAYLTFVPAREGLDATVKTVSVNLEDETPSGTPVVPAISLPEGFPRPGNVFFLSLSGDKLRQDPSSFWPSLPSLWCDAAAATANGDCPA